MNQELTVLEAGRANNRYWSELWSSRELIWILALRDISVRYKQSALGVSWALFRPIITVGVFSLVFGEIARLPSTGNLPYPIMVLAGMVPWILFSTALPEVSNSLVGNSNLIGKVYFPRLAIPLAALSNPVLEFLITLAVMTVVIAFYGLIPTWRLVLLFPFSLLTLLTVVGAGVWFAALNVRYRDVRFIIPYGVQLGLYITPIGFSSQLVPDRWKPLFYANPMAAVVDGFRWSITGGNIPLYWPGFVTSAAMASLMLYLGLRYFRKVEQSFADHM